MFRRSFWFLLGVLAGVWGTAWVKRKLGEARDALTFSNVLGVLVSAAQSAWMRLRILVASLSSPASTAAPVDSGSLPVRGPRRHIATRPASRHG